jgi:tRNA threonylcarbamoyladenosine biosynthesis protein TsaE
VNETPQSYCVFHVPDPATTEALGRGLGRLLFPGAVVALDGPLGAGKTHLVLAVAEGLDIADVRAVSSPTFTLIHEYAARLPIYHFDAYRLPGPAAFADLGADEYLFGQGVCLIEWAERVAECLPPERLDLKISLTGPQSRRFDLCGHGDRHATLVRALAADFARLTAVPPD